jgi:beta-1,4-mannosyl-glycoprotein beta-1,4-N-acetylglucosaminyltransferase
MVYDLTQINDELDMLELRLNILDPYVDYFVIGESRQTFSGKPKPLYYLENKERFSRWNHKIIHHIMPEVDTDDVFNRTAIQKDSLREAIKHAQPDDLIYYGDCDEIWKPPNVTLDGKHLRIDSWKLINDKLEQLNYSYYLNQRSSETWQGTNLFRYRFIKNLNEIRADHSSVVPNGGWHFTNCGGIDKLRSKIESYDHQEMVTDEVRDKLEERMKNGEDYLGRKIDWKGKTFEFWIDELDLPTYLLDNKEKYNAYFKS